MKQIFKILNLITLFILFLICGLGTFYKQIAFGAGLGDIFYYALLYFATILHIILTIRSLNKGLARQLILSLTFSTFTVLFVLQATIWRGSEYRWNGDLFYPKTKIENISIQKGDSIKETGLTKDEANYLMIESSDEAKKYLNFNYYSTKAEDSQLLNDSLSSIGMQGIEIIQYEKNLWGINGHTSKEIDISKKGIQLWEKEMESIGNSFQCEFDGWGYKLK